MITSNSNRSNWMGWYLANLLEYLLPSAKKVVQLYADRSLHQEPNAQNT